MKPYLLVTVAQSQFGGRRVQLDIMYGGSNTREWHLHWRSFTLLASLISLGWFFPPTLCCAQASRCGLRQHSLNGIVHLKLRSFVSSQVEELCRTPSQESVSGFVWLQRSQSPETAEHWQRCYFDRTTHMISQYELSMTLCMEYDSFWIKFF